MFLNEDELIELYEENQWIVHRAVNKYTPLRIMLTGEHYGVAKQEVEALANLSFFTHARKYNPELSNAKFSSYAYRGVQSYVLRHVLRDSESVRPPSASIELSYRVREVIPSSKIDSPIDQLVEIAKKELGDLASDEVYEGAVRLFSPYHRVAISQESPVIEKAGDSDGKTLGDTFRTDDEEQREGMTWMKKYRRFPRAHILWMTRVLQGYTQKEIQEELGLTKYIVRTHLKDRLKDLMDDFLNFVPINFEKEEKELSAYIEKQSKKTKEELDEAYERAYNDFIKGYY